MRNRIFINLILLVLVTGLTVFLLSTDNTPPEEVLVPLSEIDPGTVQTIRIDRQDLTTLLFTKQDNAWFMQSPMYYQANEFRIQPLLQILKAHSLAQFPVSQHELHRFLLEQPKIIVNLDNLEIAFGDNSPLGNQRYLKINDTIHLINDNLYQQLLAPETFFLKTELVPENSKINYLRLPEYEFQHDAGAWQQKSGSDLHADKRDELIRAWQAARAVNISAYEGAPLLDNIIIGLDNGEMITYKIINYAPDLILARPEFLLQFHVSEYDADLLFPANDTPPEGEVGPG